MNGFIRIWKEDWNFRITVVFGVLYFIDLFSTGRVRVWITVPYFTSVVYAMIKIFLDYQSFRKFIKRQEELKGRFEAAWEKRDEAEAEKVLILLQDHLKEYGIKEGFIKPEKEEP